MKRYILFCILVIGLSAQADILKHKTTNSTLWIQNSAEYKAITQMTYQIATIHIKKALEDSSWSAIDQGKEAQKHPPAIILDVDETILDNSPFQARMILRKSEFDFAQWQKWVHEENAEPIPGALEFTKYAASLGITVFYVTNRSHDTEESTKKNLEKLGFPLAKKKDVILTKQEKDNWTSDKTTRRDFVAKNYRILMLLGDDLNDFVSAKNITQNQRDKLVEANKDKWGMKWYILPNPTYGSWEQALTNFNSDNGEEFIIENRLETKSRD